MNDFPARALPADGFIGAWHLDNVAVCDDLVGLYLASPHKITGAFVDRAGRNVVETEKKDSTEVALQPNAAEPALRTYLVELQRVVEKYIAAYPYCNSFAPWTIVERINIQHYRPGGGYKVFHTERISATPPSANRHLVFMTYLNDVHDGGGTEFFHQKQIVAARKGLTLIWPADWTHTHCGIVSPTEEKYVITGWFSYV